MQKYHNYDKMCLAYLITTVFIPLITVLYKKDKIMSTTIFFCEIVFHGVFKKYIIKKIRLQNFCEIWFHEFFLDMFF